jgi:hypothetical protein
MDNNQDVVIGMGVSTPSRAGRSDASSYTEWGTRTPPNLPQLEHINPFYGRSRSSEESPGLAGRAIPNSDEMVEKRARDILTSFIQSISCELFAHIYETVLSDN